MTTSSAALAHDQLPAKFSHAKPSGMGASQVALGNGRAAEPLYACKERGVGFFAIPGTETCLRLGGLVRMDVGSVTPLPVGVQDRFGFVALGRIRADARTQTDWGVLRTFVRFGVQSRTGLSVSGDMAREAVGFNATGIDTWGRAQKGVAVDRAFVQFGGLTAGRATSFYDFYAHELELMGATPASDPQPVNMLAWTFKPGGGVSLTLAAEDPTWRRTPVAFSHMRMPDGAQASGGTAMFAGAVPVALVPAGRGANGAPVFSLVDTRQRLNVPDAVAALRLDGAWGAAQLSGALHQISVGPFVSAPGFAGRPAIRPSARLGYAGQAGLMLKLPGLGEGDSLWLQGALAEGAASYTGANTPSGHDSPSGSPFGRIAAHTADAYIAPNGSLRLSRSWSMVAAMQHYWRRDLAQSVFAGMSEVSYGAGIPAGMGSNGGFSRPLSGSRLQAAGTRLSWSPVKDLTFTTEVAWVKLWLDKPGQDLRRMRVAPRFNDSGWMGAVRVERSF